MVFQELQKVSRHCAAPDYRKPVHFDSAADEAAAPTLSALVRKPHTTVTAKIKLSYLTRVRWIRLDGQLHRHGFTLTAIPWTLAPGSPSPTATLSSFPDAHAQIVAGRLNAGSRAKKWSPWMTRLKFSLHCWPRGLDQQHTPRRAQHPARHATW